MKHHALILTILLVLLIASACGPKATEAPAQPPVVENPVTEPPTATQVAQELPATGTPAPAPTEAPIAEDTPAPVQITHVDIPGDAAIDWTQEIRDCNTGERVTLGATTLVGSGCDDWSIAKIERPVMTFNDTFIPALDINRAYMGNARNWYYASIRLHSSAAGNLPADLGVALELDIDIDSRGDYLITAAAISSEWSTDGVQVWQDTDGDVGGNQPQRPDGAAGNGYETLLFDAGLGDDPDLAWVRVNPADGSVIEVAFKEDLMPASGVYAWWVWTNQGGFDPAQLEFVDALDPDDTWRMDNTCGWIFGARPSTLLRNLCEIITPTPTPTATATEAPERKQPTAKPGQPTAKSTPGCVQHDDAWCEAQHPNQGDWNWDRVLCKCYPQN